MAEAQGDRAEVETIGEAGTRAAQIVGHPGERQAVVFERAPERRLPRLILGRIDGLRIGKIREDPRCRLGNDAVALAHGVSRGAACRPRRPGGEVDVICPDLALDEKS